MTGINTHSVGAVRDLHCPFLFRARETCAAFRGCESYYLYRITHVTGERLQERDTGSIVPLSMRASKNRLAENPAHHPLCTAIDDEKSESGSGSKMIRRLLSHPFFSISRCVCAVLLWRIPQPPDVEFLRTTDKVDVRVNRLTARCMILLFLFGLDCQSVLTKKDPDFSQ